MQSMQYTAPANTCKGVLPLCRNAVGAFYCSYRLGPWDYDASKNVYGRLFGFMMSFKLPGSGRIDTAIWMHYLDANWTAEEEATLQLHKNVASNIEQVMAATQGTNYTATCLPSRKLYKLDEPDTPKAMNDREKWRERVMDIRAGGTTWWWWWWWVLFSLYLIFLKSLFRGYISN